MAGVFEKLLKEYLKEEEITSLSHSEHETRNNEVEEVKLQENANMQLKKGMVS